MGSSTTSTALPLKKSEIEMTLEASTLDWSEIDPSILGTLFERGLDPDKRSQLGAHYTDHDKIMLIVEPVVVRPWLAQWATVKAEIATLVERSDAAKSRPARTRLRSQAERLLRDFLDRLRRFTVLDPACGSGNFLYLALRALKDLEHRVQLEAEAMGLPRAFPEIGPANVKGIEINPYAAELARVSVWIGEIQWMRRNGFTGSRDPILNPLDTIECRDAILGPDGEEPDWPQADVVIGNPPFLGGKLLRGGLGDEYIESLRRLYSSRIHGEADLVCHWFDKAGRLVADGRISRAGLVATNSIRGGRNRSVLDQIVEHGVIFDAWSDEPWVIDGAAVRVSLVCFTGRDAGLSNALDGAPVTGINPDLTAGSVDLTKARKIAQNIGAAFMGDIKGGAFDVAGDMAREWLRLPANPNGRPNSDVLKPWMNGMDMTRRQAGKWVVDFGFRMDESDAALYEAPFTHIAEHVRPARQRGRHKARARLWWRHVSPGPETWRALDGLPRYIATPTVAKHRLFVWLDSRICPDHQLIVVARDDDTTFGILHSRFHESWSLRLGTWLGVGNDPRYTPTTTFETYPLPDGTVAGRSSRRLRQRPTRNRHRQSRPPAGRAARPLAQPARMGRLDRRARSRLSQAPRPPRRGHRQGAQETHPHQPLQRPPPMARRRPRRPRRRRRGSLRLAGRHLPRRRPPGVASPESTRWKLITKASACRPVLTGHLWPLHRRPRAPSSSFRPPNSSLL